MPATDREGYKFVGLWKENEVKQFKAHRLVLETFVGPCPEHHESRHLDNNPSNNRLSNLEWATKKDNASDKIRFGTQPRGETQGGSKLTERRVRRLRELHKSGYSFGRLSRMSGVGPSATRNAVKGITWGHVR